MNLIKRMGLIAPFGAYFDDFHFKLHFSKKKEYLLGAKILLCRAQLKI